jgi:hypothetical protein
MDDFVFNVAVSKASVDDPWAFRGVASTTSIDRQGERMTEKAIADFKEQIKPSNRKSVPLCAGTDHKSVMANVLAEIGKIEEVGGDDGTLEIYGRLDPDHPYSKTLANRLQEIDNPPDWKLSIGGNIPPGGKSMLWDIDLGQHVVEISKIDLDHIFLCRGRAAVNQDTDFSKKAEDDWVDVVLKAASVEVSDKPWGDVDKSKLPKECFLYVGDPEKKSTWKFPVYEGSGGVGSDGMYSGRGPLNRAALSAAAGRLSSTDETVLRVVEPKLKSLYAKINQEYPSSHKAEDTLEADTMPDEVAVVPTAEDGVMHSRIAEKLLDTLVSALGIGKAAEPAPVETAPEVKPEEPAEPAVEYASKADLEELRTSLMGALDGLETTMKALSETVGKMEAPKPEAEKAEEAPADKEPAEKAEESAEGKTEEAPSEASTEEKPAEKAEEVPAETAPVAGLEAPAEPSEKAELPKAPPVSAQVPLENSVGKSGTHVDPDKSPDIFGALEHDTQFVNSVVKTFKFDNR